MRALALLLVLAFACNKPEAEREKQRIQERAADELRNLKDKLAGLEIEASKLAERVDDVDKQLTKLYDELSMAIDDYARAAIVQKLDALQLEREDIERKLEELRKQVAN